MPNICNCTMYVIGTSENVAELVKRLKAGYNYGDENFEFTSKHFFRIFDVYSIDEYENYAGNVLYAISFECAWSVYSCMFEGHATYYSDLGKRYSDRFHGTNICETCKELQLQVEIWSEEPGMSFEEHYVIDTSGNIVIDECISVEYYDVGYESYEDYLKDNEGLDKKYILSKEKYDEYNELADGDDWYIKGFIPWDINLDTSIFNPSTKPINIVESIDQT